MRTLDLPPPEARRILELAREDRAAAQRAMGELPLAAQVALVCETPVPHRGALLSLAPEPAELVPALPPAELCFTALAVGLEDAGWLLEHATAEQITTCVDLDLWSGAVVDRKRLGSWLVAFCEGGDPTLLRAARAIDLEAWTLHLMDRVEVVLKPSGDDDWSPPPGGQSIDGQFFLVARSPSDDLEDLLHLLRVLFQQDYWLYFRMLQAVIWELPTETEEWALRWRSGRLQDLGFPPLEEAKALFALLEPNRLDALPAARRDLDLAEWPLPVWMPTLPAGGENELTLFRALAELSEQERRPLLLEFLSVANRVAVARELPLGEAETLPSALAEAARFTSVALEHLAARHGVSPTAVLRRLSQARLFQIGFQLERALGRAVPPAIHTPGEDGPDETDGEAGEAPPGSTATS